MFSYLFFGLLTTFINVFIIGYLLFNLIKRLFRGRYITPLWYEKGNGIQMIFICAGLCTVNIILYPITSVIFYMVILITLFSNKQHTLKEMFFVRDIRREYVDLFVGKNEEKKRF